MPSDDSLARRLLNDRREQSKAVRDDRIVERAEIAEEQDHTGGNYHFSGRDPQTGDLVFRTGAGNGQIRASGISNSDPGAPGAQIQITESSSGAIEANFNPVRPTPVPSPQPSSEDAVGVMAVLLDSLVQGDAPPSCVPVQDAWALYAIVQWVRIPRVLILFSFPQENNSPVDYSCPRYDFGRRSDGAGGFKYMCYPTTNPYSEYKTYGECRSDNPISCGDDETGIPPDIPLDPETGYPYDPEVAEVRCRPNYGGFQTGLLALRSTGSWYIMTYDVTEDGVTYPSGRVVNDNGRNQIYGGSRFSNIQQREWVSNRFVGATFFSTFGRSPRCGDSITVRTAMWREYYGGSCRLHTSSDSQLISHEGDFVQGFEFRNILFTWQRVSGQLLDWTIAQSVGGCGDYARFDLGDGDPNAPGTLPPSPPPPPPCYPDEDDPSDIRREFWIGGHIRNPIKLPIELNEEDEYEVFATLTSDGYIVTVKHGRELDDNDVEVWCKIEQFSTTNLTDWRTEEYLGSKELNPTVPIGEAGVLLQSSRGRSNLTEKGRHKIDPSQSVSSVSGGTRPLTEELLLRPEGSSVGQTIAAKVEYTPNGGIASLINAPIYRIDSVLPSNLNDINGGCVEIQDVEMSFSPLFLAPE